MGDTRNANFGAKMRRAREARGVSLRQIAAATKISVAALEGLERNDISRLPGGIFSRAFVRSYAIEVGLDPEETVREFIAEFPTDAVTAGSPHVPQEDHAAIESERESAAAVATLVAISLPLVGAILYLTLGSQPKPKPVADVPLAAAERAPDVVTTAAVEPLTFEIVAVAPLSIEVDIDGVRRDARDLRPGERLVFAADREMRLQVSDAGAVHLTINRQPAAPIGAAGEARSVQIGRDNYGSYLTSR